MVVVVVIVLVAVAHCHVGIDVVVSVGGGGGGGGEGGGDARTFHSLLVGESEETGEKLLINFGVFEGLYNNS